MKKVLCFAMVGMVFFSCCSKLTVNNSVVKDFDVNRYLGDWYEIARLDHSFERGIEYAKANYSIRDDGKIKVLNSGIKKGKESSAEGKAKFTDTPAHLRVSFFGPFYADYRILMIGPKYDYALVGSGSDNYLWILSRTPYLPDNVVRKILQNAKERGYNTDNLIWVKQK